MEELRLSRYRSRNAELYATLGQGARDSISRADSQPERAPGPYETSYDVAHGYCADRLIVQP